MSLSFGSKKATTTTQSSGERDPWEPTIPYLTDYLSRVGKNTATGATGAQTDAFNQLKANAAGGNPWTEAQKTLTNDLYAAPDRTGMVGDAYKTLQGQLGDYASGKFVDPMQNPQIREMLTQVGDDISSRINAQFAGAGRDLSGANQTAVAKGVSQGTLGLLLDQYNQQQGNQIAAAGQLYNAGTGTAQTQAQLDAARAGLRSAGAASGQAALDMENYSPNSILQLEQQQKMLPYEDLATLGSLLFPVAGLGEQQNQTGTSKTNQTGFGLGLNILSDERAKEGIEEIGKMADGTPMYRYRYKGDPTGEIHVGPMAQEVERRQPDAVDDNGPGGLKTLDLDAATRKAAEIVRKRKGGK